MASTVRSYKANTTMASAVPNSSTQPSYENSDASVPNSKMNINNNAIPKRALGDITNFAVHDHSNHAHPNKNGVTKIRRTASTKVASTNSTAARRAKNSSLVAATKRQLVSPMSTSGTVPRRTSSRLAKRNAATTASEAVCELNFDENEDDDSVDSDECNLPLGVIDIDLEDRDDPRTNAQYACEIQSSFISREIKFMADPEYMARQNDITVKMRAILIDWLVDVHQKFKLQAETLHLTVNIIDRFLEITPVMRRKLQLVGVTAMLIASKYEEIYAPEVADFVYISDKAYNKEEILSMEAIILNVLKFDVTVPSSLTFMSRCLKAARAVVSGGDSHSHKCMSQYLVELSLQDSAMLRFRPSTRAAAACILGAKLCMIPLSWCATMSYHSGGRTPEELMECEMEMRRLLENERDLAGTNKLTAVKRKFASMKYYNVSSNIPAFSSMPTNMDICSTE